MVDVVGYQQWLGSLKRHPAFINNYWCAMLAYDMEENKSEDGFKIPYYIVEEELIKEDKNVEITNREDAYASAALRHWLVHLLKAYNEQTNALNFEEKLRHFIIEAKILPPGIAHPLRNNGMFHNLPSECKLWILYKLRTYKKPEITPNVVARDPLGNSYYIVGDCRLYAHITRKENHPLPIDEATLKDKPWEPLYRFVHSEHLVQLCEDQSGWDVVWNALTLFKLNDLLYTIRPIMTVKSTGQQLSLIRRDQQRRAFEEKLSKMGPIPSAKIWENLSKQQKKKLCSEDSGKNHINILKKEFEAMNMKQPNPSVKPASMPPVLQTKPVIQPDVIESETVKAKQLVPPTVPTEAVKEPEQIMPKPAKKNYKNRDYSGKCWNFPQCPLQNHCKYVHPTKPCTKFPDCPEGWECLFLHGFCPNDLECDEPNCAYDHENSMTTYYRIPREPENVTPRPIASVAPTVRKSETQSSEDKERAPSAPASSNASEDPPKDAKRCGFYPQCRRGKWCTHFHPTQDCKKFADEGKCASGSFCLFKHGACPEDGACEDMKCVYEHFESPTVMARIMAIKQQQGTLNRAPSTGNLARTPSMSNLSRAPSVGNLSTISGRRKSVSFAIDSDDESPPVKKESTTTQPVGILRPTGFNSQGRCKYGPRCTNRNCELTHPSVKCKAFPKCPNGGACIYLHDVCANDGVCSKENCDFEHLLPHEIDNTWCPRGSRCSRVECKLLHPQECIGRCPTPEDCWKYHRPGAQTAAPACAPPPRPTPPPVPPRRTASASPATTPQPAPNNGPGPMPGYEPHAGYPGGVHAYGQAPPFMHPSGYNQQYGYDQYAAYPPGPGFGPNHGYQGYGGYGHPHPMYQQGPGYGQGGYHAGYGPEYGYQQGLGGYGQSYSPVPPPRSTAPPPYPAHEEEDELLQRKRAADMTRL